MEDAIWARCGEDGWPSETHLHPWVFLDLPGKERAIPAFQERVVEALAGGQVSADLLYNLRAGLNHLEELPKKSDLVECLRACLNWMPASTEGRNPLHLALSQDESKNRATSREIGETLAKDLLPQLDAGDLPTDLWEPLRKSDRFAHIPALSATAFQVARLWPDLLQDAVGVLRSALASRNPDRVYPAYTAIFQFIEHATDREDVPRDIREMIIHACEQRTQPGLSMALLAACRMCEGILLNNEDIDRISVALPDILREYHYDQRSLEVPSLADLPIVRKRVHQLLGVLPGSNSDLEKLKAELAKDPLPEVRAQEPIDEVTE